MHTGSSSQTLDAPRRKNRAPKGLQEILNRLAKVALSNSPCCYFECFADRLEADLDQRTLCQLQHVSFRSTTYSVDLQRGDASVNEVRHCFCDVTTQTGLSLLDDSHANQLHLVTEKLVKAVHGDELKSLTITKYDRPHRDDKSVDDEVCSDWSNKPDMLSATPLLHDEFADLISEDVFQDPSSMTLEESTPDRPYEACGLPVESIRDFRTDIGDSDVSVCDSSAAEGEISAYSEMAHYPAFDTQHHQWKLLENDVTVGETDVLDDFVHSRAEIRTQSPMVSSSRGGEEYDHLLANDDGETVAECDDHIVSVLIDMAPTPDATSHSQCNAECHKTCDESLEFGNGSKAPTGYPSSIRQIDLTSMAMGYDVGLGLDCCNASSGAEQVETVSTSLGVSAQCVSSFESVEQSLVMSDRSDVSDEDHPLKTRISIDIERMMNSQETGDGLNCFYSHQPFLGLVNEDDNSGYGRFVETAARRTGSNHLHSLEDEDAFIGAVAAIAVTSDSSLKSESDGEHERFDSIEKEQTELWANFHSVKQNVDDDQPVRVFLDDGVSPRSQPSIPLHRTESREDLLILDRVYGLSYDERAQSDVMGASVEARLSASVLLYDNDEKPQMIDCKPAEAESNAAVPNSATVVFSSNKLFDRTISCPLVFGKDSLKCRPSSYDTKRAEFSLMRDLEPKQNWASHEPSDSESSAFSVIADISLESMQRVLLHPDFPHAAPDHSGGSSDTEVSPVADMRALDSAASCGKWDSQQKLTEEVIRRAVPNHQAWTEYLGSLGKLVPIDESIEWLSEHDAINIPDEKSDLPAAVWEPSVSDILYPHAAEQPACDADVSASEIHQPMMSTVLSRPSMSTELEDVIQQLQRIKLTGSYESTELSVGGIASAVTSERMDTTDTAFDSCSQQLIEYNVLKEDNDDPAFCSLPAATDTVVLPIDLSATTASDSISEILMKEKGLGGFDSTCLKESHALHDLGFSDVSEYCRVNASNILLSSASAQPSRLDTGKLRVAAEELVMSAFSAQFIAREEILSKNTFTEATENVDSQCQSDRCHEIVESVDLSEEIESSVCIGTKEIVVDEFRACWGSPKYRESGTTLADSVERVGTEKDEHDGDLVEMSESYERSEAEANEFREYDVSVSNEHCIIKEITCLSDLDMSHEVSEPHIKKNEVVPEPNNADQVIDTDTFDVSESVDEESTECCESDTPTPCFAETERKQFNSLCRFVAVSEPGSLYPTELLPFVVNEQNDSPTDALSLDAVAEFARNSTKEDQVDFQHDMNTDINNIKKQEAEQWLSLSSQQALASECRYSTGNNSVLISAETESSHSAFKSTTSSSNEKLFELNDSSQDLSPEEAELLEDSETVNESDVTLMLEDHNDSIYEHLQMSNSRWLFTIPEIETDVSDEGDEKIEMLSQGDSPDLDFPRDCEMHADLYDLSDAKIDERFSMDELDLEQDTDVKCLHSALVNEDYEGSEDSERFGRSVSQQLSLQSGKQYSGELDNSHGRIYHLHGKVRDAGVLLSPVAEKLVGTVEQLALPSIQQVDELVEQAEVTEFFDAVDSDEEDMPSTLQVQSEVSLHHRMGLANEEDVADRRLGKASRPEVDLTNSEVSSRLDVSDVMLDVSKEHGITDKAFWIPPRAVCKMVLGVDSVLPYISVVDRLDQVESQGENLAENDQKETEVTHAIFEGNISSLSIGNVRDVPADATPTDLQCNLEKIHTISDDDDSDAEDNDELNEHTKMTWKTLKRRRTAVDDDKIPRSSRTGVDVLSRLDNVTPVSSLSNTSKSDDHAPDEVFHPLEDNDRRLGDIYDGDDDEENETNHNINKTVNHSSEQLMSHGLELHRTTYSNISLNQELSGTLEHRVFYGSSDTVWSAETVYSDAVSEKGATKTDAISTSSRDLKGEDGVTTDDEFY